MASDQELEAILVRNIADVEGAISYVRNVMDRRLWVEAAEVVEGKLEGTGWLVKTDLDEQSVLLASSEWSMPDPKGEHWYAWFTLGERLGNDGESDETWLAEFLCAGPHSATVALIFDQQILTSAQWRKLLRASEQAIAALQQAGLSYDASQGALFLPVTLDPNALEKAFREDDFDIAFAGLANALDKVMAATPTLNELIRSAVSAAK